MIDRSPAPVQMDQDLMPIRVLIHGGSKAGKAAVECSLSEIAADARHPRETDDDETLRFDWMIRTPADDAAFTVRAEVLTTPADAECAGRLNQLLDWADVVIFVADATEGAHGESLECLHVMRSELGGTTPYVVMADMQDMDDPLDTDHLRSELGLDADVVLVEVVAETGSGVEEVFGHAVLAALGAMESMRVESSEDLLLEQLQDPEVPTTSIEEFPSVASTDFARFRLDPEGAGGPDVVLTATQWRVVARLANGAAWPAVVAEPVGASVMEQLRRRGLAAGPEAPANPSPMSTASMGPVVTPWFPTVPTFQSMVSSRTPAEVAQPPADDVDLKNEQYRALRELRRHLRG